MGVPINDWTGKIIGSTFENANTAITPKHGGNVFCAIEVITAATFASSEGLIAEQYDHDSRGYSDANPDGIASDTKSGWINTEDTDAGVVMDSIALPVGTIIHGRWTGFKLASGSVIAYESK
tara:strand:+ start:563 stop:928 length:366 start_codon:yes stop_codon:yes gene_type:complete